MKDRGIILALILLCSAPSFGADWTMEAFLGGAWNVPSSLTVVQRGYSDVSFTARYEEKTFEGFPYYDLRISRWSDNKAWELELIHHKIYLANPSSEIQNFSISDGFNIISVNRAWNIKKIILRLGAGAVLTHPESTIRGMKFDEFQGIFNQGFYFSGAAVQAALGKHLFLWKGLFLSLEGKVTAAFVQVPIEDGHADVTNVAFHILVGFGYRI